MTPESALGYINAAKSTSYTVAGQFSGGEDQGAYRVVDLKGKVTVLKLSNNPRWRRQVERAKAATDHLRPLGYPVPEYLYVDANDTGTFWLESELPGLGTGQPTPSQITDLLRLIDLQKGQTISAVAGQDWSWYVDSVVFRGESGLVRVLMQFSAEASALAAGIEGLVQGLAPGTLGNADLVHGDLTIGQVLTQADKISAVLDWDQVGYGDRTLDLAGLWFSLVGQPAAREPIMQHMLAGASREAVKICAAYKMLALVSWHINKTGGDVAAVAAQTRLALDALKLI